MTGGMVTPMVVTPTPAAGCTASPISRNWLLIRVATATTGRDRVHDRRVVRIRLTDRDRRLVDGMPAEYVELHAQLLEPSEDHTKTVVADALRLLLDKSEQSRRHPPDRIRRFSAGDGVEGFEDPLVGDGVAGADGLGEVAQA